MKCLKYKKACLYAALFSLVILLEHTYGEKNSRDLTPVAVWTFEKDPGDSTGTIQGELIGNAKVENGRLILDGKNSYLQTTPLPFSLREKTISVRCANKNKDQRYAGVVAVTGLQGVPNDTVCYGYVEPKRWGPGSEWAFRSANLQAAEDKTPENEIVEVDATYSQDGEIAFYVNGKPYGKKYNPDSPTQDYRSKRYKLLIGTGIDHRIQKAAGSFNGDIDEVSIYDKALKPEEIERIYHKKQSATNPQQNP
ncbi:MAG: LamG domain-containing protein [Bacteroidetes bacterium]|nr:LamG domain-containing protein [Bacteroidota bacterium]